MNNECASISSRDDINKTILQTLDSFNCNWKHESLESSIRKYWSQQKKHVDLSHENLMTDMPIICVRDSSIYFAIYQSPSPDRELQLAIALVKSILGDYDDVFDIDNIGYKNCPQRISENDFYADIARRLLAMRNN